uniref:Uncharacterized protein n=1 Tax=Ignisphaera aggregans TaxID=334771 RepID=A0A7J3Z782_9CREN
MLSFLFYRREPRIVFREPEIVITRLYTVKDDGSIEPVESSSLPPEKQKVVEEKIKSLKGGLKHEAIQKATEEWRKYALRHVLILGTGVAIGSFIATYLYCRIMMCPTCTS